MSNDDLGTQEDKPDDVKYYMTPAYDGQVKSLFTDENISDYLETLNTEIDGDTHRFYVDITNEILESLRNGGDLLGPFPDDNPLVRLIFWCLNSPKRETVYACAAINNLLDDIRKEFGEQEMIDVKKLIHHIFNMATSNLELNDKARVEEIIAARDFALANIWK